MKASVLILTFNEQTNIARCIESLSFSDDILIVDSFSTDDTLNIACQYPNVTVLQNSFKDFSSQRNFGLENYNFKNEIVIHLDADEVLTKAFINALESVDFQKFDVVDCPNRIIMNGDWLKYSSGYPVFQSRVAKRDIRFVEVGHGQKIISDVPRTRIAVPYDHYNFSHGIGAWFSKHVIYAEKEAVKIIEGRQKKQYLFASSRRTIYELIPLSLRPILRFIYSFIFKLGFLDGLNGLRYCLMLTIYEAMIVLMVREKENHGSEN